MKKFVLIIAVLLLPLKATAYEGTPEEQVNQFFNEISSGHPETAVDNLYSSNPAMKQKLQQLTMLKQQVALLSKLFGERLGVETYKNENISPSIKRLVKIEKYQLHPIIWEFYFYQVEGKWLISQGTFNDHFGYLR